MARGAGLVPRFNKTDINNHLLGAVNRIDQAIIMRFSYVGEQFITNARNNGAYADQTGNLRSSIGYIVLKNGRRVAGSSFAQVKAGSDGAKTGKQLIAQLRREFSSGYVLIVVAGMDYAAAVESRGKDVLTGSSIVAKNDLRNAIEAIRRNINGNE